MLGSKPGGGDESDQDKDESLEEYLMKKSPGYLNHDLAKKGIEYEKYLQHFHQKLSTDDVDDMIQFIRKAEADSEGATGKVKEALIKAQKASEGYDLSAQKYMKVFVCHSMIYYDVHEDDRTDYVDYFTFPDDDCIEVVIMTPFGFKKRAEVAKEEADNMKKPGIKPSAVFTAGSNCPSIVLKWTDPSSEENLYIKTIRENFSKEKYNKKKTIYFSLNSLVQQISSRNTRLKESGIRPQKVTLVINGCMNFINASSKAFRPSFQEYKKEEAENLKYVINTSTTTSVTDNAPVVEPDFKRTQIQVQFADNQNLLVYLYQLDFILSKLEHAEQHQVNGNFLTTIQQITDQMKNLQARIKAETDKKKKRELISEYMSPGDLQFDGSMDLFMFIAHEPKSQFLIPKLSALRELKEEWLVKNGLRLKKVYLKYLFPLEDFGLGNGIPDRMISLLHQAIPENKQKWPKEIGKFDDLMDLFISRFNAFNRDPIGNMDEWKKIKFGIGGPQGDYEGFTKDDKPCGWGRWVGANKTIIAQWIPEGNGMERIKGTMMELSDKGLFFGSYYDEKREDDALIREMVDGKPIQKEGYYIEGNLSGPLEGYELLPSGKAGRLLFEETYSKGEKKDREEFGE